MQIKNLARVTPIKWYKVAQPPETEWVEASCASLHQEWKIQDGRTRSEIKARQGNFVLQEFESCRQGYNGRYENYFRL